DSSRDTYRQDVRVSRFAYSESVGQPSPHATLTCSWHDYAGEKSAPKWPPANEKDPPQNRERPLTCGAPLRNRTVDLLLTITRQTVHLSVLMTLSWRNVGRDERREASESPRQRGFAPRSAPQI